MKFWLTVSTNGVSTWLCQKWNNFCLFWFTFGCAWVWLAQEFIQKCSRLFCFVVATRFSCKVMCTITAKQHNCRFLVHKRNIQNVAAGFALFTVGETSRFFGWNVKALFFSTCWTCWTSPIVCCTLLSTHNSFFLFLVGWKGTLSNNCLLGTQFFFLAKKACFVCFCRLYVLLYHNRNFVNK